MSARLLRDYPALCKPCMNRSGRPVKAGDRVVCEVDDGCSGTVSRIEDGLAVIATNNGREAWVPIGEVIKVVG